MRYIRRFNIFLLSGFIMFTACGNEGEQEKNGKNVNDHSKSAAFNITTQELIQASLGGNLKFIKRVVDEQIDVNKQDQEGRTSLMMAAFNGHSDVVQYLLDNGAVFQLSDEQGRTPLIYAASGPYPETVKLLLEAGADINKTDKKEGWSALMWAAAEGNKEVVQILLDYGADPNLKDNEDESARDFASSNRHSNVVEILMRAENEK